MFNNRTNKINSTEYLKDLIIPDDWDSLEDFTNWYINDARMPLMIPYDAVVVQSDDAVAVSLFRKGQYQVELYLIYPQMYILKHSHPRMEVITMALGGGSMSPRIIDTNTSASWGNMNNKLLPGEEHGGEMSSIIGNGQVILTFEKWLDPTEMTTAAAHWKGKIRGELQAKLIKNQYSNSTISEDYADITT